MVLIIHVRCAVIACVLLIWFCSTPHAGIYWQEITFFHFTILLTHVHFSSNVYRHPVRNCCPLMTCRSVHVYPNCKIFVYDLPVSFYCIWSFTWLIVCLSDLRTIVYTIFCLIYVQSALHYVFFSLRITCFTVCLSILYTFIGIPWTRDVAGWTIIPSGTIHFVSHM